MNSFQIARRTNMEGVSALRVFRMNKDLLTSCPSILSLIYHRESKSLTETTREQVLETIQRLEVTAKANPTRYRLDDSHCGALMVPDSQGDYVLYKEVNDGDDN